MSRDFKHFSSDFAAKARLFQQMASGELMTIIKVEGLNHFDKSWDNQGFTNVGLKAWGRRKASKKDKGKKKRAILIDSGDLRDSIKGRVVGMSVVFSSDLPYAQVHNEGGKAGRGAGFEMPQRQFMGPSRKLDDAIRRKINRAMDTRIFK